MCSSGRLIAFVNQFRANFVSSEGKFKTFKSNYLHCYLFIDSPNLDEGIFPNYQNTFQGLINVIREPSQPR